VNSRLLASVVLVASCLWQGGCSTVQAPAISPPIAVTTAIPPADRTLDNFIARIPVEQAQTAAVARAMTHISLGNARVLASRKMCGGIGLRQGKVTESVGPVPVHSPATQGGKPVWYYRISQQPGLSGCETHNSTTLYQAMQEELPGWIRIEPAGTGPQQLGMLESAH
jgi:hypothetical protein